MPVPGDLGGSHSAKRPWSWVEPKLWSLQAPCDTPVTGAARLVDGLPQRTDDGFQAPYLACQVEALGEADTRHVA